MNKPHHCQTATQKQRALALFQQGKLKQACAAYEKICRQNKTDAEAHYMLGSVYGRMGKFEEAARYLLQCIKLQPDAFVAYCALGAAYKELGRYAKAEQALHEAHRLQPLNIDVLLELAHSLLNQENLDAAEGYLQTAIQIKPDSAEALFGLGEIQHAKMQITKAVDYYQRALKIAPSGAAIQNRMGHALHQLGKYSEAATHLKQAIQLNPRLVEAYNNLGHTLLTAGHREDAEAAYRAALEIKPADIGATLGLVNLYEHEGNFTMAYELMEPLIQQGINSPGLATTYLNLCRHFDSCSEAIAYAEKILNDHALPVLAEGTVQFALGKTLDNLGEFDKAFSHYQRANSLKLDTFNAIDHIGLVNSLIQNFSWQFHATAPRASVRTERPVFIIGMPRSGTSLTEQILSSHPDVYGAGELIHVSNMVTGLPGILGSKPPYPYNLNKLTTGILNNFAETYLARLSELDSDAKRVCDKMPHNFLFLGLISLVFPKARVIHCIRDPRDTCLSIYFQDFSQSHSYASNLEQIGLYYHYYERLMQHFKAVLDIPMLEMRYEDLVENQEEMSRKLVDFAGLEWNDRCLQFHRSDRTVATASYDQVRQAIYSSSVGRWKHYEKHLAPLLHALEHG